MVARMNKITQRNTKVNLNTENLKGQKNQRDEKQNMYMKIRKTEAHKRNDNE